MPGEHYRGSSLCYLYPETLNRWLVVLAGEREREREIYKVTAVFLLRQESVVAPINVEIYSVQ